jgi:hypothetical protein
VVVFTQYDRVLRSNSKTAKDANKILDECITALHDACKSNKVNVPHHICVSTRANKIPDSKITEARPELQSRDGNTVELVNLTRRTVDGDLWLMWAVAQRISIREKVDACVT